MQKYTEYVEEIKFKLHQAGHISSKFICYVILHRCLHYVIMKCIIFIKILHHQVDKCPFLPS